MDSTNADSDYSDCLEQCRGKTAEVPCQNCGRLVTITLPFVGCVFCSDCMNNDSGWNDGTEQFYEPNRLTYGRAYGLQAEG